MRCVRQPGYVHVDPKYNPLVASVHAISAAALVRDIRPTRRQHRTGGQWCVQPSFIVTVPGEVNVLKGVHKKLVRKSAGGAAWNVVRA